MQRQNRTHHLANHIDMHEQVCMYGCMWWLLVFSMRSCTVSSQVTQALYESYEDCKSGSVVTSMNKHNSQTTFAIVHAPYTEVCSANLYNFQRVISMADFIPWYEGGMKLYTNRGLRYLKPDGVIRTQTFLQMRVHFIIWSALERVRIPVFPKTRVIKT